MNVLTQDTDLAQRIAATMARPLSEIYDTSGNLPFEPETQTIVGEVPLHLRGLHNLLHEIGITHDAATATARACDTTFREELQIARDTEPLPEQMPPALKEAKEAAEKAISYAQAINTEHNIVRGLFFTSLEAHFPELFHGEKRFSSYSLLSDWKVAGNRTMHGNSINVLLESVIQALTGGIVVGTLRLDTD